MNSMLILGITGTFGSGKSFVTGIFKRLGVATIDADAIVHTLLKSKGSALSLRIKKNFGTTNRRKLAKIVFSSQKKRKQLEQIIHPEVINKVKKRISGLESSLVAIELPLLFEAGVSDLVNKVLVVSAKENLILKRMLSAGRFKKEEILKRLNSQIPLREKERRADFIIDNNGTKEETKKQVEKIYQEIMKKEKNG